MDDIQALYDKDLVLRSDARTQTDVFKEVGNYLLSKDLVTADFVDALIEREANHPTGLDLAPVGDQLPNVAIPHTETEYCKTKAIVFVKLTHPIMFHNMIAPDQELDVTYLFFIINHDNSNQTNVLSGLMGFMTNEENMRTLEKLETPASIYEFLTNNKEGEVSYD